MDDTDIWYDFEYGIEIMIKSDSLFSVDLEQWTGPSPTFSGIYRGCVDSLPDVPVRFTCVCDSGGVISGEGGSAVLSWQNDQGRGGKIRVTAPNEPIEIEKGLKVAFGEGTFTDGESLFVDVFIPFTATDRFLVRAYTFDGYLVLRQSVEDRPGSYKVVARYDHCDRENFEFFRDPYGIRTFVDKGLRDGSGVVPDTSAYTVLNGFPYTYAVVAFDRVEAASNPDSIAMSPITEANSRKVYPSVPPGQSPEDVYVVPNPYLFHAGWEEGEAKIQFVNVPKGAVIRIYDAAGGYVNTVYPNLRSDNSQAGTADWNLKNSHGKDVVSGIYIFHVEANGQTSTGRFIVVR